MEQDNPVRNARRFSAEEILGRQEPIQASPPTLPSQRRISRRNLLWMFGGALGAAAIGGLVELSRNISTPTITLPSVTVPEIRLPSIDIRLPILPQAAPTPATKPQEKQLTTEPIEPKAGTVLRNLTVESTPKSRDGWSLKLATPQEGYLPGILTGRKPTGQPFQWLARNPETISVPDARYYPQISHSDMLFYVHENQDGSRVPAIEEKSPIEARPVRWLISNSYQIITIQNLNDSNGMRTAHFQALLLSNLTAEEKEAMLTKEEKSEIAQFPVLYAFLIKFYSPP